MAGNKPKLTNKMANTTAGKGSAASSAVFVSIHLFAADQCIYRAGDSIGPTDPWFKSRLGNMIPSRFPWFVCSSQQMVGQYPNSATAASFRIYPNHPTTRSFTPTASLTRQQTNIVIHEGCYVFGGNIRTAKLAVKHTANKVRNFSSLPHLAACPVATTAG